MKPRIKMTVELDVTEAQALALQAMFKMWTQLGQHGYSRSVAFNCDGDGDFQPNCKCSFTPEIRPLTDEITRAVTVNQDCNVDFLFDYDPVYEILRSKEPN